MRRVGMSIACAVAFVMGTSGCATQNVAAQGMTAGSLLDSRVKEAVAAQQELAGMGTSATEDLQRQRTDIFTDAVTLDYVGDLESALGKIAKQYGFGFEIYGKRPPEGLMINVLVKEPKPVIDIVKAIAYQYPGLIDVNVGADTIELIYKKG